MFGLLGGLLLGGLARGAMGGALGGGGSGGVLGGLLNRAKQNQGGGSAIQPTGPASNKSAPMAPEPQEQSGQTTVQQQPQAPQQQPYQAPMVEQAGAEIAQPVEIAKAEKKNPLEGLTDEAPAAPKPIQRADEPVPQPQQIVNKTDVATPVSRPVDEKLGQTPVMLAQDGVANQLMDSAGNRQVFDYQDANPSETPDLPNQAHSADQGYRFVGPTTVGGAMPARQYRMRV